MIKPLKLGNHEFTTNLVQGPLAGVSCAPFRALVWRHSKPAFVCTEMISAKALLQKSKLTHQRYMVKDPSEGPVCYQLAASDPYDLGEATKIVTDYGADLVDLNCGCPKKQIRSNGTGSSLLADPAKIYQLIRAMKQNTHLPVSIKIRVDSVSDERFNQEIAKAVTEAGADFLVVHGRHWSEHYDTPCNYNEIKFFVEEMKIPVIGNGDIACLESLNKMLATGCAGAMICRAGVGQPWLIEKLTCEMQQRDFTLLSFQEIGNIFIEHILALQRLLVHERVAILHARKLVKYYARGVKHKHDLCSEVNVCNKLEDLKAICLRYFV